MIIFLMKYCLCMLETRIWYVWVMIYSLVQWPSPRNLGPFWNYKNYINICLISADLRKKYVLVLLTIDLSMWLVFVQWKVGVMNDENPWFYFCRSSCWWNIRFSVVFAVLCRISPMCYYWVLSSVSLEYTSIIKRSLPKMEQIIQQWLSAFWR